MNIQSAARRYADLIIAGAIESAMRHAASVPDDVFPAYLDHVDSLLDTDQTFANASAASDTLH